MSSSWSGSWKHCPCGRCEQRRLRREASWFWNSIAIALVYLVVVAFLLIGAAT